jgi:hypothetical protein
VEPAEQVEVAGPVVGVVDARAQDQVERPLGKHLEEVAGEQLDARLGHPPAPSGLDHLRAVLHDHLQAAPGQLQRQLPMASTEVERPAGGGHGREAGVDGAGRRLPGEDGERRQHPLDPNGVGRCLLREDAPQPIVDWSLQLRTVRAWWRSTAAASGPGAPGAVR